MTWFAWATSLSASFCSSSVEICWSSASEGSAGAAGAAGGAATRAAAGAATGAAAGAATYFYTGFWTTLVYFGAAWAGAASFFLGYLVLASNWSARIFPWESISASWFPVDFVFILVSSYGDSETSSVDLFYKLEASWLGLSVWSNTSAETFLFDFF